MEALLRGAYRADLPVMAPTTPHPPVHATRGVNFKRSDGSAVIRSKRYTLAPCSRSVRRPTVLRSACRGMVER